MVPSSTRSEKPETAVVAPMFALTMLVRMRGSSTKSIAASRSDAPDAIRVVRSGVTKPFCIALPASSSSLATMTSTAPGVG